jgi:TMEM175 potassium channel family protein
MWISKARLEAFSDGVFAIAITLLVLDLAVAASSSHHLLRALAELWPYYLAYLTSFATIRLVWLGHHMIVGTITEVDRWLLRINLALLFLVSFLPFPTRLLGEFIREPSAERVAAVFYGIWLLLITTPLAGMWRYITTGRKLVPDQVPQTEIDRISRRLEPGLPFYAVAILLALLVPQVAAGLFLVIAVVALVRTT